MHGLTTKDQLWALPALTIGAIAMLAADIGIGRVAGNVAFFTVGLLLVAGARTVRWRPGTPAACVLAGLLAVTLLMPGIDGVHRWIDAGPLAINVSMLVAPLLLVVLAHLLARRRTRAALGLAIGVQVIHLLQPDGAQSAAFGVGAAVLLVLGGRRPAAPEIGCATGLLALALVTVIRGDPLEPVPEVEGVVGLAHDAAPALGILAIPAIGLLAVPFTRAAARSRRAHDRIVEAGQIALCAYVVGQLLAPIVLHVPVPVMGSGATTVLAYAAAVAAGILMPRRPPGPAAHRSIGDTAA